jgi:hypothetical protein
MRRLYGEVVKHTKLPLCRWNNKKDTPLARPSSFLKLIIALTVVVEEFHRVQQRGPLIDKNCAREQLSLYCSKKDRRSPGKMDVKENAKNYEKCQKQALKL